MIFDFLASDYPILFTLLLGIGLLVRAQRSVVREMWRDRVGWARTASRVAISALGAFMLWATVLDNWRQLLGLMMDKKDRWRSDPYLYEPPPDAIRVLTIALLGAAVLGMAYLYARYARGYVYPIILSPLGLVLFFALNTFRTRFEVGGPLSERGVDFTDVGEAVMTLIWFGMFYVVMAILIVSVFVMLWGPAAVVAALIYRNTIGRERIVEPEMFRIMRERGSGERGQGSGKRIGSP
jgi:hypothetical protein